MTVDLFDTETVADPVDAGAAPAGDIAPAAPAAEPAGGEPAVDGGAEPAAAGDAPAGSIDWNSPEARQAFEQWQAERDQALEQTRLEQQQAQEQQGRWSQIEEGLALLGIDPADFKQYLQEGLTPALQPLSEAAQQIQAEQAAKQIGEHLDLLGKTHTDLLGDGVDKLAEIVGEDGQPLFNPQQIRDANRSAVVSATVGILEASKGPDGNPTVPWTQAAEHAAKIVAERDATVAKIAVEQFRRQLENVGNAPAPLDGGGAAGVHRVTGLEGGDELAVARRWMAERGQ